MLVFCHIYFDSFLTYSERSYSLDFTPWIEFKLVDPEYVRQNEYKGGEPADELTNKFFKSRKIEVNPLPETK